MTLSNLYSTFARPKLNGVIHCGDCIEVMKSLPSNHFKVVVTSPPYNLSNTTNGGSNWSGKWASPLISKGYDTFSDKMPHGDYVAWQRDCISSMLRVIREDGAIFYNHKWRVQKGILQDRNDIMAGFPVRQIIIWQRKGGFNFNDGYFLPTYEVIYLIAKPKFKLAPKANVVGDVWQITQARNNPHPAPFPLELADRCLNSVGEGPVLDPFLGSGTTALSAELLGREWMGIELSKRYCDEAQGRIEGVISDRNKAGT